MVVFVMHLRGQYATKNAGKEEKFYYMESEQRSGGVKDFLKCRTVGLCMPHNLSLIHI